MKRAEEQKKGMAPNMPPEDFARLVLRIFKRQMFEVGKSEVVNVAIVQDYEELATQDSRLDWRKAAW